MQDEQGQQRTALTGSGAVVGRVDQDGVISFLGIPYAAPPAGHLRFAPPAPPVPWAQPWDATSYGPTAPQPPVVGPVGPLLPRVELPGEGYLNLNVWTSSLEGTKPVMVFIHGGAFTSGSGAVPTYRGSRFARDGVVLVTINYRLGADGFLWFGEGPANLGLQDQIAALGWVRENIRSFGGDPGNVTVFGESAGAMSACTLVAMPAAAGLFRRLIAQSGAARCVIDPDSAHRVGLRLAQLLGVDPTRDAIAGVPRRDLLRAQVALAQEVGAEADPDRWGDVSANLMPFEPVVDGVTLPERPGDFFRRGGGAEIDILVGTNSDEGNLFFVPTGVVVTADAAAVARFASARRYPTAVPAAYRAALPAASDGELISAIMTAGFYRIPALELAEDHEGVSYVYEFAWGSPTFDGAMGACHVLELPFVFDTLDDPGFARLLGPEPPQQVADSVHRAWVRFASGGDPGWEPYTAHHRASMRFDVESGVTLDSDPPEWRSWR